MRKKLNRVIAIASITALTTVTASSEPLFMHAATTLTKWYNTNTTVTLKNTTGFKKITVNGKVKSVKKGAKTCKVRLHKNGKYRIKTISLSGNTKLYNLYLDKTKPTITGVKNGNTYTNGITVQVKDNMGLASIKLNDKTVKSPLNITKEGNYTITATDKAGNQKKISFKISANNGQSQNDTNTPPTVSPSVSASGGYIPTANPTSTPGWNVYPSTSTSPGTAQDKPSATSTGENNNTVQNTPTPTIKTTVPPTLKPVPTSKPFVDPIDSTKEYKSVLDANWDYEINGDTVYLKEYTGGANAVIPGRITLNGSSCQTEVYNTAFDNCKETLETVTICSHAVVVSEDKSYIADNMFKDCLKLSKITGLENIEYTTSFKYLCSGCSSLQMDNIKINAPVKNLEYAFQGCENLKPETVTLPDEVENLDYAFAGCLNLDTKEEISIPCNVTSLDNTFNECISMQLMPDVTKCTLLETMNGTFKDCKMMNATTLKIPARVKILKETFKGCFKLSPKTVTLPSELEDMNSSFAFCYELNPSETIVIPTSVIDAGSAFCYCRKLEICPVITKDNKIEIMNSTFYTCTEMKKCNIYIPSTVKDIRNVFNGCENIGNYTDSNIPAQIYCCFDITALGTNTANAFDGVGKNNPYKTLLTNIYNYASDKSIAENLYNELCAASYVTFNIAS